MSQRAYRADIDGLRCIAVVSVLLAHVGLPGVAGGFVGVDVFFVISGYLITGIIARELAAGEYSILRFYERRARRILPALFVVLLASFAVAAIALGPEAFVSMAKSAVATVAFASNVWFWLTSSGYFGADVELEPLLHTWSLGVEEQFYIFFPVLLALAYRLAPRRLPLMVMATAAISFAAAVWQVGTGDAQAAFYLLPSRIWELGLGALVALAPPPVPRRVAVRASLAAIALIAILVPVFAYDATTPFPGLAALPPVLGSAMLIWLHSAGPTPVGRLLSSRPFVGIGLVSYSLYLWHWPVIVYSKVMFGPMTPVSILACIVLSIGLAVLSWRYVEQPFRGRGGLLRSRAAIFGASAAGIAATAVLAGVVWLAGGFSGRIDPRAAAIFAGAEDVEARSLACMGRKNIGGETCRVGRPGEGPASFLVWGDSHAAATMPAFERVADAAGLRGYVAAFPACAPLLGTYRVEQDIGITCARFNDAVLDFLKSRSDMPVVILEARWRLTAEGTPPEGESIEPPVLAQVKGVLPSGDAANNYPIFAESLARTVDEIRATGRRVVVLGDVPEIGWSVPETAGTSMMHNLPTPRIPTAEDVEGRLRRVDRSFLALERTGKLDFISLTGTFCRGKCDIVDEDGRPLYRDGHHLSATGSIRRLTPIIETQVLPQIPAPLPAP